MKLCLPPAVLRAVKAASHSLPGCKQGLHTAANESTLALLFSHPHISKYESLLSLERMVYLLYSAESQ